MKRTISNPNPERIKTPRLTLSDTRMDFSPLPWEQCAPSHPVAVVAVDYHPGGAFVTAYDPKSGILSDEYFLCDFADELPGDTDIARNKRLLELYEEACNALKSLQR